MKTRQNIFIGILFIFLILLGYNYFMRPFEGYFDVKEDVEEQVEEQRKLVSLTRDDVLNKLSNKEKIAQMISYPLTIGEPDEVATSIDELSPGFITIFGSKISSESAKKKITEIESLYKDNLLAPKFAVDHEGGKVQRLSGEGYTIIPSWKELCEQDSVEFKKILSESAKELRDTGIDIVLAPVLDVGSSQVLKDRVCSDSYALVADRGIEYVAAFNSFGVLPVLKHFPGIGNIGKDLHNSFDSVEVLEKDANLYKYVIEHSSRVGVMISHAGVVNQDPDVPCSLSEDCVSELKNAYPQILIFTDALEMKSVSFDKNNIDEEKNLSVVSQEAVLAGNEVLIYGDSVTSKEIEVIVNDLSEKYEKEAKFKELVDKAVLKIVDYKYTGKQI